MQKPVSLACSILRSVLALFRSRESQAIVELVLCEQLSAYAHQQRLDLLARGDPCDPKLRDRSAANSLPEPMAEWNRGRTSWRWGQSGPNPSLGAIPWSAGKMQGIRPNAAIHDQPEGRFRARSGVLGGHFPEADNREPLRDERGSGFSEGRSTPGPCNRSASPSEHRARNGRLRCSAESAQRARSPVPSGGSGQEIPNPEGAARVQSAGHRWGTRFTFAAS